MKIKVGAVYCVFLCFSVFNQYSITLCTGYVIYDDACHLKKFAINKSRSTQTETTQRIISMKMVVDRFHFPGHVDSWCKKNCNPNDFDELKGVRQFIHKDMVDFKMYTQNNIINLFPYRYEII